MRILVAPDKFKGSLGATEAGAAIAVGLRRAAPGRRSNKVALPVKRPPAQGERVSVGAASQPLRCVERAGSLCRLVELTVANCVAFPPLTISESVWHSCSGTLEMIAPETIPLNGTVSPAIAGAFHKIISFSVLAFYNFSS
jgi:hypothetical protein